MSEKTPLWLDIKKEYIDDNFEKLVDYLKDGKTQRDSFYQTTIALLKERVGILVEEIAKRDIPDDEMEIEARPFNVRLMASMLLACPDDKECQKVFMAMITELKVMVPKFSESLLKLGMACIENGCVDEYGFTWDDVKNFAPEMFAFKVKEHTKFVQKPDEKSWLFCNGACCVSGQHVYVLDSVATKNFLPYSSSLDFGFGINAVSDSVEKVKATKMKDIETISKFTADFINSMRKPSLAQQKKFNALRHYGNDDVMLVKVVGVNGGRIFVETCDEKYEKICGEIVFKMRSINYYYSETFAGFLKEGNVMKAVLKDSIRGEFSIERTFLDFLVNDCKDSYEGPMLAKLIDDKGRTFVWLTDYGTPIHTPKVGNYKKGDFVYVDNPKYSGGDYYGKIDGEISAEAGKDDSFDENEVRRDCFLTFASEELPKAADRKDDVKSLNPMLIRLLIRQLFAYQKHIMNPSARILMLSAAEIMAVLVGDNNAAEYVEFASTYLRVLVRFTRDEDISNISLRIPAVYSESQSALLRMSVFQLLKLWGRKGQEEALNAVISDFREKQPMIARLAQIIQTSNSMREIVTDASINVLKREIIKTLSIETENESDLEAESGIYLGVESGSVEFKKSVVFPADGNMQPDENRQVRNVLRGVCAFLNSTTGGTLYIGVSDQGYVVGIQNDLDVLRINSVDLYMRVHIQDQIKRLIGLEVLPYINMEMMYDEQVVAIHVEPYPYHIAELEGKAYVRVNAESREMTDSMREQMLERKVNSTSGRTKNISILMQAISGRKCVILHGYCSSHGGAITDRHVEVYNIAPEHDLLMAFDLKDNTCKVFNINRVGYVEMLDEDWRHMFNHKSIKVDHFHMSGTETIRCFLELDMMARNLLIEEFPTAKDDITKAGDDDSWYFTTEVYDLAGIGRFYMGLANHIKIVEAPELKQYVEEFKNKYLV